jgi:hypothetical protein
MPQPQLLVQQVLQQGQQQLRQHPHASLWLPCAAASPPL